MPDFVVKDSGKRQEFASGMRRDTAEGKPRFDLLVADGVPYEEQILYRDAMVMARGMEKYGAKNWQRANSGEEMDRFKASAYRHFMQWFCGVEDEDHASQLRFNVFAYESIKYKLKGCKNEVQI